MTINHQLLTQTTVLCSLLWAGSASANEAMDLLSRMQAAVRGLNYTGQLVYSRGDELSTFSIVHQSGPGGEEEKVVRLNQTAGMPVGDTENFSLANFESLHAPGQQAYSFDLGGDAVVAEHPCKVVVVRPKDKFRFLHRYCIDPGSGMLLKYSLMDRGQKVLEQLLFTQLSWDEQSTTIEAAPSVAAPSVSVQHAALAVPVQVNAVTASSPDGATVLDNWDFQSLPAGFGVVKVIPGTNIDGTHQVVLSDGMTSISVFIAPASAAKKEEELSYASGATHVLGLKMAGHVITFVGEVPSATLQSIKNGLRYIVR